MPLRQNEQTGKWSWVDVDLVSNEPWDGKEWSADYYALLEQKTKNNLPWELIPTRHVNHPARKAAREKAMADAQILLVEVLKRKERRIFKEWANKLLDDGKIKDSKYSVIKYWAEKWRSINRNPRKGLESWFDPIWEIQKIMSDRKGGKPLE